MTLQPANILRTTYFTIKWMIFFSGHLSVNFLFGFSQSTTEVYTQHTTKRTNLRHTKVQMGRCHHKLCIKYHVFHDGVFSACLVWLAFMCTALSEHKCLPYAIMAKWHCKAEKKTDWHFAPHQKAHSSGCRWPRCWRMTRKWSPTPRLLCSCKR